MPKQKKNSRSGVSVDRKILVVFSDTHAGHKYGLLNPATLVWEEVPYYQNGEVSTRLEAMPVKLTPVQEWLWKVYTKNIENTVALADGSPIMVVHNGDLTQGVKYPEYGNLPVGVQFMAATANLMPWLEYDQVKDFMLVWGTASHIFEDGSAPNVVMQALKSHNNKVNYKQAKHALLDYAGVRFDIAHHGAGGGRRNWLKGNEARYYTRSIMLDAVQDNKRPPDVVIRSHYHTRIEEYLVDWYAAYGKVKTEYILTPSYQGMNEFTRQATKSAGKVLNGHVAFEIINGKVHDTHWFVDIRDVRQIEVI
jgi:hypothetical protein